MAYRMDEEISGADMSDGGKGEGGDAPLIDLNEAFNNARGTPSGNGGARRGR